MPTPIFEKGRGKTGGRKRGVKNKLTNDIKEMMFNTLNDERVGGLEGFIEWVIANKRNKELFYAWLMKMLPTNIDADIKGDLVLKIERIFTDKRPKE